MSVTPLKKSPRPARDRHYLAERLRVRAEMQSMGEDEISEVIDERALKARSKTSVPADARVRGLGWLLDKLPEKHRVWVVLALIALVAVTVWRGGALAKLWP